MLCNISLLTKTEILYSMTFKHRIHILLQRLKVEFKFLLKIFEVTGQFVVGVGINRIEDNAQSL